ncbi:MAG: hypothetical protein GOP50_01075 [Candidatus Heimdallarchaeota archaeon]|nr:hypothetical protein [Candidatus Heimdallarchaeota archaeon]
MERTSPMNNVYVSIRKELFELADMVEIRIDVGYILEELEELSLELKKVGGEGERIFEEMNDIYRSLLKKYQNKLAAFLSSKERNLLTEKINKWLLKLPSLF